MIPQQGGSYAADPLTGELTLLARTLPEPEPSGVPDEPAPSGDPAPSEDPEPAGDPEPSEEPEPSDPPAPPETDPEE